MSLFDHRLLGANVEGEGSSAHAEGLRYARTDFDMLLLSCSSEVLYLFARTQISPNERELQF